MNAFVRLAPCPGIDRTAFRPRDVRATLTRKREIHTGVKGGAL